MSPSPIFQFMVDNPWLSFFLAWPTALVLVSAAWCATTLITNTFGTLFVLIGQFFALVLTLVRGYPPKEIMYERGKKDGVLCAAEEEEGKLPEDR